MVLISLGSWEKKKKNMDDGQVGLNSHLTREPVKFRDDAFCVKLCDLLSAERTQTKL